jgi:uncharacterized protein YneF (UPF0154 family)
MEVCLKISLLSFMLTLLLSSCKCQDPRVNAANIEKILHNAGVQADDKSIQEVISALNKNKEDPMLLPPLPERASTSCSDTVYNTRVSYKEAGQTTGVKSTIYLGSALLVFFLTGAFSAGVAAAFQAVRKYVYHDADNLDTAFDAGGKVSIGLTATTIVSQWTWAATLLQSCTVATRVSIHTKVWLIGFSNGSTHPLATLEFLGGEIKKKSLIK